MGVGAFTILPPATTYARIWKATRNPVSPCLELVTTAEFAQMLLNEVPRFDEKILKYTIDTNRLSTSKAF